VIDKVIDHSWPAPPLATIPAGLSRLDDFSARWTGTLEAPEDGEYEIGVEGDDGYRLTLDGAVVLERWENGGKRLASKRQVLRKGQRVNVTLEYYQATSDRSLRLAWRTPSALRALVENKPSIDASLRTYLPKGTAWYDFWTNQRHEGGQSVARDVPLDIVPLYVRAGAILPMGPALQTPPSSRTRLMKFVSIRARMAASPCTKTTTRPMPTRRASPQASPLPGTTRQRRWQLARAKAASRAW
jgi:alpha-D-xyloside xylohydrolase